MASISYSGANARLTYSSNSSKGSSVAKLRCKQLTISYGVVSDESHAKRFRAIYPHLRVQGSFAMTFDFIHWREFNQAMNWFRDYIEAVIEQRNPSYMQVQLDSRQFLRLAFPTTGISFGDHRASMVFSPTINFISVADPRDTNSGIQTLNKAISRATLPAGDQLSTKWFYPNSRLNSPGQLQSYLYDQGQFAAASAAAQVQDTIEGANDGTTNTSGAVSDPATGSTSGTRGRSAT